MAAFTGLLLAMCLAQQGPPAFDAVSIKPSRSLGVGAGGAIKPGGRVSMQNVPLVLLVGAAYETEGYRLSGVPEWAKTEHYDLEAAPGHPVDRTQTNRMLQTLLADRCGLRVHHETVTIPGYSLMVDKGGSKLRTSSVVSLHLLHTPGKMDGPASMPELVQILRGVLGAPVEDATGLAGRFDVLVSWKSTPGLGPLPAAIESGVMFASDPEASIFDAVRRQLGLRLKPATLSIDRIVIDHIERPTGN